MLLDGAKLIFMENDGKPAQTIIAKGKNFTIGSLIDCDCILEQAEKVHCRIECDAFGHVTIYNKSEKNPISVNGETVTIKRTLFNNAKIQILDRHYVWQYSNTTTNVDVSTDNMSTPSKQIGIPIQPPNSCPTLKYHRQQNNRFTVHNLRSYRVDSDESNCFDESSAAVESETKTLTETQLESTKHDATDQQLFDITPAKVDLVDSTPDKKTSSTEKRLKTFRNVWGWSGMTTTSYSPRETGVRIEKTFTALIPPTTPNSSLCRTPKGLLERLGVSEKQTDNANADLIVFATPSKQRENNPNNSKSLVVIQHKKSAMKIVDLTTPSKLRTESPFPKTITNKKPTAVKSLASFSEKTFVGLTPSLGNPKTVVNVETPNSTSSAITVDSSSATSDLSEVSVVTSTTSSRPKTTQSSITPGSISRKQPLLASAKKQQKLAAHSSLHAPTTPISTKLKFGASTTEKKSAAQSLSTKKLPAIRKLDVADSPLTKSSVKPQNSNSVNVNQAKNTSKLIGESSTADVDCAKEANNMLTTSTPFKPVISGGEKSESSTQLENSTEFFSALLSSSEDEAEETHSKTKASVSKPATEGDELLQQIEEILNTSDELKRQIQATTETNTAERDESGDEGTMMVLTVSPPPASIDLIEPIIPTTMSSATSDNELKKALKSSVIASVLLKAIDNAEKQKSLSPKEDDEKENKINKSSVTPSSLSSARRRISLSTPVTHITPVTTGTVAAFITEEINNSVTGTPLTPKRITKRRPSIDEVPLTNVTHNRTIDHFNTENMGAIIEEEPVIEDLYLEASASLTSLITATKSTLNSDTEKKNLVQNAAVNVEDEVVMSPLQCLDESFAEPCEAENNFETQEKEIQTKTLNNTVAGVSEKTETDTSKSKSIQTQISTEEQKESALLHDESFGEVEYLDDSELLDDTDDQHPVYPENLTFEIEVSKSTIENVEKDLSLKAYSTIELLTDDEDDEQAQNQSMLSNTINKANSSANYTLLTNEIETEISTDGFKKLPLTNCSISSDTIEVCQVELETLESSVVRPIEKDFLTKPNEIVDLTLSESLELMSKETNREDETLSEKITQTKENKSSCLEKTINKNGITNEPTTSLNVESAELDQKETEELQELKKTSQPIDFACKEPFIDELQLDRTLENSVIAEMESIEIENKKENTNISNPNDGRIDETNELAKTKTNTNLCTEITKTEIHQKLADQQKQASLNVQQNPTLENEVTQIVSEQELLNSDKVNKTMDKIEEPVSSKIDASPTDKRQNFLATMEVTQIITEEQLKSLEVNTSKVNVEEPKIKLHETLSDDNEIFLKTMEVTQIVTESQTKINATINDEVDGEHLNQVKSSAVTGNETFLANMEITQMLDENQEQIHSEITHSSVADSVEIEFKGKKALNVTKIEIQDDYSRPLKERETTTAQVETQSVESTNEVQITALTDPNETLEEVRQLRLEETNESTYSVEEEESSSNTEAKTNNQNQNYADEKEACKEITSPNMDIIEEGKMAAEQTAHSNESLTTIPSEEKSSASNSAEPKNMQSAKINVCFEIEENTQSANVVETITTPAKVKNDLSAAEHQSKSKLVSEVNRLSYDLFATPFKTADDNDESSNDSVAIIEQIEEKDEEIKSCEEQQKEIEKSNNETEIPKLTAISESKSHTISIGTIENSDEKEEENKTAEEKLDEYVQKANIDKVHDVVTLSDDSVKLEGVSSSEETCGNAMADQAQQLKVISTKKLEESVGDIACSRELNLAALSSNKNVQLKTAQVVPEAFKLSSVLEEIAANEDFKTTETSESLLPIDFREVSVHEDTKTHELVESENKVKFEASNLVDQTEPFVDEFPEQAILEEDEKIQVLEGNENKGKPDESLAEEPFKDPNEQEKFKETAESYIAENTAPKEAKSFETDDQNECIKEVSEELTENLQVEEVLFIESDEEEEPDNSLANNMVDIKVPESDEREEIKTLEVEEEAKQQKPDESLVEEPVKDQIEQDMVREIGERYISENTAPKEAKSFETDDQNECIKEVSEKLTDNLHVNEVLVIESDEEEEPDNSLVKNMVDIKAPESDEREKIKTLEVEEEEKQQKPDESLVEEPFKDPNEQEKFKETAESYIAENTAPKEAKSFETDDQNECIKEVSEELTENLHVEEVLFIEPDEEEEPDNSLANNMVDIKVPESDEREEIKTLEVEEEAKQQKPEESLVEEPVKDPIEQDMVREIAERYISENTAPKEAKSFETDDQNECIKEVSEKLTDNLHVDEVLVIESDEEEEPDNSLVKDMVDIKVPESDEREEIKTLEFEEEEKQQKPDESLVEEPFKDPNEQEKFKQTAESYIAENTAPKEAKSFETDDQNECIKEVSEELTENLHVEEVLFIEPDEEEEPDNSLANNMVDIKVPESDEREEIKTLEVEEEAKQQKPEESLVEEPVKDPIEQDMVREIAERYISENTAPKEAKSFETDDQNECIKEVSEKLTDNLHVDEVLVIESDEEEEPDNSLVKDMVDIKVPESDEREEIKTLEVEEEEKQQKPDESLVEEPFKDPNEQEKFKQTAERYISENTAPKEAKSFETDDQNECIKEVSEELTENLHVEEVLVIEPDEEEEPDNSLVNNMVDIKVPESDEREEIKTLEVEEEAKQQKPDESLVEEPVKDPNEQDKVKNTAERYITETTAPKEAKSFETDEQNECIKEVSEELTENVHVEEVLVIESDEEEEPDNSLLKKMVDIKVPESDEREEIKTVEIEEETKQQKQVKEDVTENLFSKENEVIEAVEQQKADKSLAEELKENKVAEETEAVEFDKKQVSTEQVAEDKLKYVTIEEANVFKIAEQDESNTEVVKDLTDILVSKNAEEIASNRQEAPKMQLPLDSLIIEETNKTEKQEEPNEQTEEDLTEIFDLEAKDAFETKGYEDTQKKIAEKVVENVTLEDTKEVEEQRVAKELKEIVVDKPVFTVTDEIETAEHDEPGNKVTTEVEKPESSKRSKQTELLVEELMEDTLFEKASKKPVAENLTKNLDPKEVDDREPKELEVEILKNLATEEKEVQICSEKMEPEEIQHEGMTASKLNELTCEQIEHATKENAASEETRDFYSSEEMSKELVADTVEANTDYENIDALKSTQQVVSGEKGKVENLSSDKTRKVQEESKDLLVEAIEDNINTPKDHKEELEKSKLSVAANNAETSVSVKAKQSKNETNESVLKEEIDTTAKAKCSEEVSMMTKSALVTEVAEIQSTTVKELVQNKNAKQTSKSKQSSRSKNSKNQNLEELKLSKETTEANIDNCSKKVEASAAEDNLTTNLELDNKMSEKGTEKPARNQRGGLRSRGAAAPKYDETSDTELDGRKQSRKRRSGSGSHKNTPKKQNTQEIGDATEKISEKEIKATTLSKRSRNKKSEMEAETAEQELITTIAVAKAIVPKKRVRKNIIQDTPAENQTSAVIDEETHAQSISEVVVEPKTSSTIEEEAAQSKKPKRGRAVKKEIEEHHVEEAEIPVTEDETLKLVLKATKKTPTRRARTPKVQPQTTADEHLEEVHENEETNAKPDNQTTTKRKPVVRKTRAGKRTAAENEPTTAVADEHESQIEQQQQLSAPTPIKRSRRINSHIEKLHETVKVSNAENAKELTDDEHESQIEQQQQLSAPTPIKRSRRINSHIEKLHETVKVSNAENAKEVTDDEHETQIEQQQQLSAPTPSKRSRRINSHIEKLHETVKVSNAENAKELTDVVAAKPTTARGGRGRGKKLEIETTIQNFEEKEPTEQTTDENKKTSKVRAAATKRTVKRNFEDIEDVNENIPNEKAIELTTLKEVKKPTRGKRGGAAATKKQKNDIESDNAAENAILPQTAAVAEEGIAVPTVNYEDIEDVNENIPNEKETELTTLKEVKKPTRGRRGGAAVRKNQKHDIESDNAAENAILSQTAAAAEKEIADPTVNYEDIEDVNENIPDEKAIELTTLKEVRKPTRGRRGGAAVRNNKKHDIESDNAAENTILPQTAAVADIEDDNVNIPNEKAIELTTLKEVKKPTRGKRGGAAATKKQKHDMESDNAAGNAILPQTAAAAEEEIADPKVNYEDIEDANVNIPNEKAIELTTLKEVKKPTRGKRGGAAATKKQKQDIESDNAAGNAILPQTAAAAEEEIADPKVNYEDIEDANVNIPNEKAIELTTLKEVKKPTRGKRGGAAATKKQNHDIESDNAAANAIMPQTTAAAEEEIAEPTTIKRTTRGRRAQKQQQQTEEKTIEPTSSNINTTNTQTKTAQNRSRHVHFNESSNLFTQIEADEATTTRAAENETLSTAVAASKRRRRN